MLPPDPLLPTPDDLAIRSLLVPLDGSPLAEVVLPAALALGRRLPARVLLLHILERGAPSTVHGQPHLTGQADAVAYLDRLAARFAAAGVVVETHVHPAPENDVARAVAAHAAELGTDLTVLATHGSGGVRDFLFGSIAQQVLRRGDRPIFLVPARGSHPETPVAFAPRLLAVALNGTTAGSAALPWARLVAQAFAATIHLISAVPTLGTMDAQQAAAATLVPGATRAILDLEESAVARSLTAVVGDLQSAGLAASAAVVRGDPAATIVAEAERCGADLLVFATHARAGIGSVWSGSVGAKVLARFARPLLLIRAPDAS